MSLVQLVKSEHNYCLISSYQTDIIPLYQLCTSQFHVHLTCALFVLFSLLLLFLASRDICPTSISEQGKCCDIHHQGLCMYDSSIQFDTVFPYVLMMLCSLELLVVLFVILSVSPILQLKLILQGSCMRLDFLLIVVIPPFQHYQAK